MVTPKSFVDLEYIVRRAASNGLCLGLWLCFSFGSVQSNKAARTWGKALCRHKLNFSMFSELGRYLKMKSCHQFVENNVQFWQQPGLFVNFYWIFLANNLIICSSILVAQASLDDKGRVSGRGIGMYCENREVRNMIFSS